VFFQIKYRNGISYFTGFILNNKGEGYAVFGIKEGEGSVLKPIGENKQNAPTPSDLNIPRYFKYPRDKYLGIKLQLFFLKYYLNIYQN
jgi:hypothetical protein